LKVGDEWPLVLDIHRPATSHFDGVVQARVLRPPDVFSADELRLLARFADGIGMEYGDIDVVRDRASGLIYAVDANRTPLGGAGMALIQPAELAVPLAAALGRLLANWRPLAE
ncbi:MAG TPA: hypothetical protein VH741_02495, partial [Candidatus Limnocylindrales bacterium]